jgi:hypothetical protein
MLIVIHCSFAGPMVIGDWREFEKTSFFSSIPMVYNDMIREDLDLLIFFWYLLLLFCRMGFVSLTHLFSYTNE